MTSFADVFRPSLQAAALMAEYQDGLFEDVRAYMADFRRHAREHTETKPQGYEVTIYPSRLHDGPAFGLNCSDLLLGKLAVSRQVCEAPVHFAARQGDLAIIMRFLACRPTWLCLDTIACALAHNQMAIATFLLQHRSIMHPRPLWSPRRGPAPPQATSAALIEARIAATLEARIAAHDRPELLKLLAIIKPVVDWPIALAGAMQVRATTAMQYLYDTYGDDAVDECTLNEACAAGLLTFAQQLHNDGHACTMLAMDRAAMNGHLEVVRFLHEHRREGCSRIAMVQAAANGHTDVALYLLTHFPAAESAKFMSVARGRDLLQCLHRRSKRRCSVRALATAATHGDAKALKWILKAYPLYGSLLTARGDGFQCLLAAACGEKGNLDIVVRLCTHVSPPLPPTNHFVAAATREIKRVLDSDMLSPVHMAMAHGHLEILDYLETRQSVTWSRVIPGHVQARICAHIRAPFILSYLRNRGVVLDGSWATAACGYSRHWAWAESIVATASSPMGMQWLVHAALRHGRDVVATLCQFKSRLNPPTAEDIVDCAYLPDVVRYLHATYPTSFTANVLETAVSRGVANTWLVRFLLGHGVGRVRDAFPQTIRHQDAAGFARLWPFCKSGDGVDDLLYLATLAYGVVDRPNRVLADLWLETFTATFELCETPTFLTLRFARFASANPSTAAFLKDLRDEGLRPFNWLVPRLLRKDVAAYIQHILTTWEQYVLQENPKNPPQPSSFRTPIRWRRLRRPVW